LAGKFVGIMTDPHGGGGYNNEEDCSNLDHQVEIQSKSQITDYEHEDAFQKV